MLLRPGFAPSVRNRTVTEDLKTHAWTNAGHTTPGRASDFERPPRCASCQSLPQYLRLQACCRFDQTLKPMSAQR